MSEFIRAWLLQPVINFLQLLELSIAMNQAELKTALDTLATAVDKIGTETTALLAEVQTLTDAIAAGITTPEVDAALAAVQARVAAVDALVPDAPAP
jgi:uncharacterized protein YoxC